MIPLPAKQIMELIKEIADDKLVIMVTHNPEVAEQYADRIVKFKDGQVIDDSNPMKILKRKLIFNKENQHEFYFTALKLIWKLLQQKWRTALTAFASSIGLIGIALILKSSSLIQKSN